MTLSDFINEVLQSTVLKTNDYEHVVVSLLDDIRGVPYKIRNHSSNYIEINLTTFEPYVNYELLVYVGNVSVGYLTFDSERNNVISRKYVRFGNVRYSEEEFFQKTLLDNSITCTYDTHLLIHDLIDFIKGLS